MRRVLAGAIALVALVVACGQEGDGGRDGGDEARQAAVYAAVVLDVAEDLPDEAGDDPADRAVFVEALGPEIGLEVQAGVVSELQDLVDVTFVDDREAAVDGDEDGAPVRDGAALVALGPVPAGSSRVEVEVERYHREGREERLAYEVERVGDGWEVVGRRPLG